MGLAQRRESLGKRLAGPPGRLLARAGISPNVLTLAGFLTSLVAAAVIALGHPAAGGLVLLLAGAFDLLDGAVARAAGRSTAFGALLDSTLDRLSEAAVLFGLLVSAWPDRAFVFLIFLALVMSFMVSYIRARAEGLGLSSSEGLFTRTERVLLLALGLLLGWVKPALALLALLSLATVGQRLFLAHRRLKGD